MITQKWKRLFVFIAYKLGVFRIIVFFALKGKNYFKWHVLYTTVPLKASSLKKNTLDLHFVNCLFAFVVSLLQK